MCNVSAVVCVDAELNERRVKDVSQSENVIVSQWREVSADDQHELRDKVDEILRPLGLETRQLVMRRANGVALYFICLTLSAVMSLRDDWRSQQLRYIVQELFTLLSTASNDDDDDDDTFPVGGGDDDDDDGDDTVLVKRLIWPVTEYEQCLDLFNSLQGKEFSYILCTCNCLK